MKTISPGWRRESFAVCSGGRTPQTVVAPEQRVQCHLGTPPVNPVAIEIRKLELRFSDNPSGPPILHNLTLTLQGGRIHGLFGPNGAGKTSLLRFLLGQENDRFIASTPQSEIVGDAPLGYVPQNVNASIMEWLTATDNICLPHVLRGMSWRSARNEAIRRVAWLLSDLPLHRSGSLLSGGERQMTVLARELARDPTPRLLLLDEWHSSIDHQRSFATMLGLRLWCRKHDVAVLSVAHGPVESAFLCDSVSILSPRPSSVLATIVIPRSMSSSHHPREAWVQEASQRIQRAFLDSLPPL